MSVPMARLFDIVSYLMQHWWIGIVVVVWIGAAIGTALGTFDILKIRWMYRQRMKELRKSRIFR